MIPSTFIYGLALLHVATAQNATSNSSTTPPPVCDADQIGVYNSFNATSTNDVPAFDTSFEAFEPPLIGGNGTWTLHFGVSDRRNASANTSTTDMYMWLDASDRSTDLTSRNLSYSGCLVSVTLDRPRKSTGNYGTGDGCRGVFTEQCYNALVEHVMFWARKGLDDGNPDGVGERCEDAVSFDDVKGCEAGDGWSASRTRVIFGEGNATTAGSDGCGPAGVTKDTQLRTPAWVNTHTYEDTYDNHTYYDELASNASPVFLIGMMKIGTDPRKQHGWGAVRLVCAQPGGYQSAATSVGANGRVYGTVVVGVVLVLLGVM